MECGETHYAILAEYVHETPVACQPHKRIGECRSSLQGWMDPALQCRLVLELDTEDLHGTHLVGG